MVAGAPPLGWTLAYPPATPAESKTPMNTKRIGTSLRVLARSVSWLLFGLMATAVSPVMAQSAGTANITGRVINQATGEYLRNANIAVAGTDIRAVAEAGGYYHLNSVPAGTVQLSVTYAGLDPQEVTVQAPAGQTVTQDVALTSRSYSDVVQLDQYVVATEREGNAKAIMEQRNSWNPKKVISADALGSVSEGNVGEFLKLMPGVAMDYVEADTRAMRVRGLNPKYANVLLDGMQVASAGSSNIGTGRAFEFEQLSIASVETVELTKAPTADQPSSVAGTVNLRTKGAFDRKGRRITFNAGLSANSYYMDLEKTQGWDNKDRRKLLPNANFEYSDIVMDGKLGVIVGLSMSETIAAQKHVWFFNNTFNQDFSDNRTEIPTITRIWFQDGPKPTSRGNYNLRLDYRFSDALHAYARIDYTTYDARFYNRTMDLRPTATAPGATWTDQTVTAGRVSVDSNQFMTKEGNTYVFTTGASYRMDKLLIDVSGHYSRARNWYGNLEHGHFTDFSSSIYNVAWRMTRPSPGSDDLHFTQLNTTPSTDWTNIANYRFDPGSIGWHERRSKDQQWTGKADFTYDLSRGRVPQTIKFGGLTNLKVLDVKRAGLLTVNITGPDKLTSAASDLSDAAVAGRADDPRPSQFVDTGYHTDFGVNTNMNGIPSLSPWKLYDFYRANPGQFTIDQAAIDLARLRGQWDFKERINSVYIEDKFTFGALDLMPGIRHERTKSWGKGINTTTNLPVAGGNKYSNTLKYLHANYKFSQQMRGRASYHEAITRADLGNLVPGVSAIDDTNAKITASNPDLKPERSKTINAGLEYYFEPVGSLSANVFYTKVRDRQFGNQVPLGAAGYPGLPGTSNYTLVGPVNISVPTTYQGFELDYQQQLTFLPGALRNTSIFANHTRIHYDDWAFNLGSPEMITNAGIAYGQGRFSGRLNFNWVGKILQNPARTYSAATNAWTAASPWVQMYQRDRLVTDLNVEFRLSEHFSVFADGRNILNEPSIYTYYQHEDNFERILRTGAIWMFGVKGRF